MDWYWILGCSWQFSIVSQSETYLAGNYNSWGNIFLDLTVVSITSDKWFCNTFLLKKLLIPPSAKNRSRILKTMTTLKKSLLLCLSQHITVQCVSPSLVELAEWKQCCWPWYPATVTGTQSLLCPQHCHSNNTPGLVLVIIFQYQNPCVCILQCYTWSNTMHISSVAKERMFCFLIWSNATFSPGCHYPTLRTVSLNACSWDWSASEILCVWWQVVWVNFKNHKNAL